MLRLIYCSSRCLAHIVNLATQAMISSWSKASHYNGDPSNDHIPEAMEESFERDEIGLVRAIVIKVSTSLLLREVCAK